ncbi:uncharacterized protein [Fopius arisanus]|uniref:Nucleolar protein 16 n=1 Tax=Fopius arisanus TaxID=64838 RepID=A0A9R1T327_9HYME|nr:PREDICTED: uncharacterized protein LOC105265911 [Fopius arisanus]
MTKVRKVKRRKTYKVSINRKRLRNKLRKVPTITCPQIKQAWDTKKSTKTNLHQMGLAYDPNQILKVPNVKNAMIKKAKRQASGEISESEEEPVKKKIPKKVKVAQELEAEARAPRQRMFRLPKGQVLFLTYLMDKYGEDYEAMARDKKNHYQLTWRQIRQKINTFKNIPEQYSEYLVQSGEIVLEDPTSLAETKKKIAEENVQKYCVSKKKKEKKSVIGRWIEETMRDEDTFETEDTLQDEDEEDEGNKKNPGEKKLKLFPDDEENENFNGKRVQKNVRNEKKEKKREDLLQKLSSSDSEDSEELEGDDHGDGFRNLDDMSEEELSEDDILDDGEFVTDDSE